MCLNDLLMNCREETKCDKDSFIRRCSNCPSISQHPQYKTAYVLVSYPQWLVGDSIALRWKLPKRHSQWPGCAGYSGLHHIELFAIEQIRLSIWSSAQRCVFIAWYLWSSVVHHQITGCCMTCIPGIPSGKINLNLNIFPPSFESLVSSLWKLF